MNIRVTPKAFWHLQWMAQRTDCELSSMGILSLEKRGFTVADVVLVKQEVSAGHVDLDMEWWAEKQVDLFETRGIQPWQSSAWIHTHPAGVERPSSTDEETMRQSFGAWDFAVMIILTKCGRFYARLDFNHDFGPPEAAFRQRFSVECDVEVLWTEAGDEPIGRDTLAAWEREFQELVRESAPPWPGLSGWDREPAPRRPGRSGRSINAIDQEPTEISTKPITEVSDYARACINSGIDPDDPPAGPEPLRRGEGPEIFERYFGRKPMPDPGCAEGSAEASELDQLQLDGGILEWWGD